MACRAQEGLRHTLAVTETSCRDRRGPGPPSGQGVGGLSPPRAPAWSLARLVGSPSSPGVPGSVVCAGGQADPMGIAGPRNPRTLSPSHCPLAAALRAPDLFSGAPLSEPQGIWRGGFGAQPPSLSWPLPWESPLSCANGGLHTASEPTAHPMSDASPVPVEAPPRLWTHAWAQGASALRGTGVCELLRVSTHV